MSVPHIVVFDQVGFGGFPRYTCETCGSTCLREPWMDASQWLEKLGTWQQEHPCAAVRNEGWRG